MIKTLVFIFSFSFSLMWGSFENMFPNQDQIPNSDKNMMRIMDQTSSQLESKYGLHPIGFGMRGQNKFKGVSIEYKILRKLTKDEARDILFDSVETFLKNINNSESVKHDLEVYPFSKSNVGITIYIEDESGGEIFDPEICVARWYSKGVYYHTEDPKTHRLKDETNEETHEEALELVRQYRAAQIAQSSKN